MTAELQWFDYENYVPPTLDELSEEWGGWKLDGLELYCCPYGDSGRYPIGLERFTHPAEMLDMIMQVAHKNWATDAILAGLVRALNDILHPQAHLCSCGSSKKLSAAAIRRIVKTGTDGNRP